MARNDPTQLVILGLGVFVLHSMADQGKLGPEAKYWADRSKAAIKNALAKKTPPSPQFAPPAYAKGPFGDQAAMNAVNPNFNSQMWAWQAARGAKGEDRIDWAAFRQYLAAIGAPDPGAYPPNSFVFPDQ